MFGGWMSKNARIHALRKHYAHHMQVARNNAAVDVLDMLALTVGERILLVSATVPST